MAERYDHKHAVSYTCVDKDPEVIAGMAENVNGALFYFIGADCPYTGHCPPYIKGAELTCVVCTR